MPKLSYKNELPSSDEFQKALTQAMANSNPVDDLLELANDLREFEQKHRMSSADFYKKYQAGSLDVRRRNGGPPARPDLDRCL